jgi:GGDEF domain-containing protein
MLEQEPGCDWNERKEGEKAMTMMRWSVAGLVMNLAIFYNIERLDFYTKNFVNLSSFVYALTAIATVSTIIVPRTWRISLRSLLPFWASVYLASKLFLLNNHPLIGGGYLYLTITEVVFFLLTVVLAHHVAHHLHDFEDAVENISFSGLKNRILSQEDASATIKNELYRSRRYQHPLSLMVLEPDQGSLQASLHRSVREVQQAMMGRYVFLGFSRVVSDFLRRIDIAMEQADKQRLVLLCPETPREGVMMMVERLKQTVADQIGVSVRCGVASFPDEALTFEELLREATLRLKEDPSHGNHPGAPPSHEAGHWEPDGSLPQEGPSRDHEAREHSPAFLSTEEIRPHEHEPEISRVA